MKASFSKLFRKVKSMFVLYNADKELRKAISLADAKHNLYKRRYYVMPNEKDKLIVLCWSEIKTLRKYGRFSNKAKEPDFIRESFYFTSSRYGERMTKDQIKSKRKMWLNYIKSVKVK